MSSNINVILSGAAVQVINNNDSTTRVNSPSGNPTLAGSEATYIDFLPILASGTALTLPAATVWVIYIRNLGGINSSPSGNITVTLTPVGGGSVNAGTIVPLGIFMEWNPSEVGGGITACTLTASVNLTPCEILLAA